MTRQQLEEREKMQMAVSCCETITSGLPENLDLYRGECAYMMKVPEERLQTILDAYKDFRRAVLTNIIVKRGG